MIFLVALETSAPYAGVMEESKAEPLYGPVISGLSPNSGVGTRIAEMRQEKGMTQKDLAVALGKKSRTTITQYESGGITPPLSVIRNIAAALGTDASYLAFGMFKPGSTVGVLPPKYVDGVGDYGNSAETLCNKLGLSSKTSAVHELDGDAPEFCLSRGDLLIVDISERTMQADGRLYAVHSSAGTMNILRTNISLEPSDGPLQVTLGQGQSTVVNPQNVKVFGLVKALVKRQ